MKLHQVTGRSIALAAGLALAMSAYAQTRHDEKPHGTPKKAEVEKK
ncbi:MAG: hypothetical protein WAO95_10210 [Burkholderiales bacterium]